MTQPIKSATDEDFFIEMTGEFGTKYRVYTHPKHSFHLWLMKQHPDGQYFSYKEPGSYEKEIPALALFSIQSACEVATRSMEQGK